MDNQHYALIELPFGNGLQKFCMGFNEAASFEDEHKISLMWLFQHSMTANGACEVKYIKDVLRWGLIGGGMPSTEALQLVNRYVDNRPIAEHFLTALNVLEVAFYGTKSGADDE